MFRQRTRPLSWIPGPRWHTRRPDDDTDDGTDDAPRWSLFFDGASKGNPGHAGAGIVLKRDDVVVESKGSYLGESLTCNQAEYHALLLGLRTAAHAQHNCRRLLVFGDSKLVIFQLFHGWQVKSPLLRPLYEEAVELIARFALVNGSHIPRERNVVADGLASDAVTAHRKRIQAGLA